MKIHSTPDWDETTCGLSMWDEIPDDDDVIDETSDPRKLMPQHTQCQECYPHDEAALRHALWTHRSRT